MKNPGVKLAVSWEVRYFRSQHLTKITAVNPAWSFLESLAAGKKDCWQDAWLDTCLERDAWRPKDWLDASKIHDGIPS